MLFPPQLLTGQATWGPSGPQKQTPQGLPGGPPSGGRDHRHISAQARLACLTTSGKLGFCPFSGSPQQRSLCILFGCWQPPLTWMALWLIHLRCRFKRDVFPDVRSEREEKEINKKNLLLPVNSQYLNSFLIAHVLIKMATPQPL